MRADHPCPRARIRVVIADRHPLYLDAMARAIRADQRLELTSEAPDPWDAVDEVARTRPEVAVLDPAGPAGDEDELLAALAARRGATRFVLLTARTATCSFRAVAGGAAAVLGKGIDGPELCRAVIAVASGRHVLASEARRCIALELRSRRDDGRVRLAGREREVLLGIAAGRSAPSIAADLQLGSSTVKTYTARLYAKLGVSDRAAAVAQAMRRGLLE
jgi:two-component system nitrate/nitrite response regulator NarL